MENQNQNAPKSSAESGNNHTSSIYPSPTSGPMAVAAGQPDKPSTLLALRRSISRYILVRAIVNAILAVFFCQAWLRLQGSIASPDVDFSGLGIASVAVFGGIGLVNVVALACNLYGLLRLDSFYREFNGSFYIPLTSVSGRITRLFSLFEFLQFLNPLSWIVSPKFAVNSLVNSGELAITAIINDQSLDRAYKVELLMQKYLGLKETK